MSVKRLSERVLQRPLMVSPGATEAPRREALNCEEINRACDAFLRRRAIAATVWCRSCGERPAHQGPICQSCRKAAAEVARREGGRTGGKESNLRLTTGARALGRTLNAYGAGVTRLSDGEVMPAGSEEEVFALCGVEYLKPEERP